MLADMDLLRYLDEGVGSTQSWSDLVRKECAELVLGGIREGQWWKWIDWIPRRRGDLGSVDECIGVRGWEGLAGAGRGRGRAQFPN